MKIIASALVIVASTVGISLASAHHAADVAFQQGQDDGVVQLCNEVGGRVYLDATRTFHLCDMG